MGQRLVFLRLKGLNGQKRQKGDSDKGCWERRLLMSLASFLLEWCRCGDDMKKARMGST